MLAAAKPGEETMPDQDKKSKDVLPENFTTVEEFWDIHSTADYEEAMEPVEVEIDLASSKICCPVAKDLLLQIRRQARRQGVSTENSHQPLAPGGALRFGVGRQGLNPHISSGSASSAGGGIEDIR
jgi:hypothetical protein